MKTLMMTLTVLTLASSAQAYSFKDFYCGVGNAFSAGEACK